MLCLLLAACVAPDTTLGPRTGDRAPPPDAPDVGDAPADTSREDPAALWSTTDLPVFAITFDDADWEAALTALVETDACADRAYLAADVTFTNPLTGEEEVWHDVGVRYRGHSALATPNYSGNNRWGFKLSFESLGRGTFHGSEHVSLLGTEGDGSLLRERVALDWMNRAGVPAPRANHAWVEVNGEPLGVFPLVEEGDDRAWLAARFGEEEGHLYKVGGYCHGTDLDYRGDDVGAYDAFEPKAATTADDIATDIIPLLACLETGVSDDVLRACVEDWIDVDEWLSEIAVDMLLANVDGMASTAQNFLLYRPPEGRFVVYPYDLDLTFYTSDADLLGDTIFDLRPYWEPSLPVLPRRLREAYAPEFCARVAALAEDPGADALEVHITTLADQLDTAMRDDPYLSYDGWRTQVDRLVEAARERHEIAAREAARCEIPPEPSPDPGPDDTAAEPPPDTAAPIDTAAPRDTAVPRDTAADSGVPVDTGVPADRSVR